MTTDGEGEEPEPRPDRTGTVGIIGAGRIGQALARTARRAGRDVVVANSRGPGCLAPVVAALGKGVSAGTVVEAAVARIVVIAVPWTNVPAAVTGLHWDGQIVIDATNAWNVDFGGRTSSEIVADLVPGARLVKAANTLGANVLGADHHEAGGRRVIFLSGDDAAAKAAVVELFDGAPADSRIAQWARGANRSRRVKNLIRKELSLETESGRAQDASLERSRKQARGRRTTERGAVEPAVSPVVAGLRGWCYPRAALSPRCAHR